jgi:phosphoribosylaminoimidazole-succinocarboxamide synthase
MIETFTKKEIQTDENNFQTVDYMDNYYVTNSKKVKVKDLGKKVALTNAFFFDYLKEYHIPTAFAGKNSENSLKFLITKEYPFRVKILNCVDKRNSHVFHIKETTELALPFFEYHYGNEKESIICESHLIAFDLCGTEDLKLINRICSKINVVLKSFFERRNEMLAEVSCFFGKQEDKVLLTGDFTPSSLKVFSKDDTLKIINPYKLSVSAEIKNYSNHLFNIASVK